MPIQTMTERLVLEIIVCKHITIVQLILHFPTRNPANQIGTISMADIRFYYVQMNQSNHLY